MKKNYGLLGFLVFVLLFICTVMTSFALPANDDPQKGASMSNEEGELFDSGIMLLSVDTDPYTGKVYAHNTRHADREITYGIDVSSHNGSIDWGKVKKAGIKYVMIRAAFRGYGSDGFLKQDENFKKNIEGALDAGLQVGAYIFSQAISREEAVEEADYLVNLVKGYNITLPLVMDYEYADTGSGTGGRLYNANLSKRQATDVCRAFGRSISQDGYVPMIYANKSMLENRLYANELSDRYKVWLANYTTETSYSGEYDVWQYSSKGTVSGISGYVDCNFWYGESSTVYNGVDYASVYDYEYYTSKYGDIKNVYGSDKRATIAHFVNYGMAEGRQGSEEFDVYAYRDRYPDLKAAYKDNLKMYYLHYMNYGKTEGRTGKIEESSTIYNGVDYSAIYNYDYYIEHYPDIKDAYGANKKAALSHFLNTGMSEGRQGCAEFNVYTYKNRYADLRRAYGNDLKKYYLHYNSYGKTEGRSGSGTSVVLNPVTVYNSVDYSNIYNYNYYITKYPDIKTAYGDDDSAVLNHFVNYGTKEGRQGNAEFNVYTYKNRYADLRKVYGNNLQKYYFHYNSYGKTEGRNGSGDSAVLNPITVYEGTDYSDIYDYDYYIEKYDEVKTRFANDDIAVLEYFVTEGMSKGHQASEKFDVEYYKNHYPDLRIVYGDDLKQYYIHYINWGKAEGRIGVEPEEDEVEETYLEEAAMMLLEEDTAENVTDVDEKLDDVESDVVDSIEEETSEDNESLEAMPGAEDITDNNDQNSSEEDEADSGDNGVLQGSTEEEPQENQSLDIPNSGTEGVTDEERNN